MRALLIIAVTASLSTPAWAQPAAQSPCRAEPSTTAATPTDPNSPASGTSPGTAGSTGWTGGTGGSYIGTAPKGPTPQSPSEHAETASGLDPIKGSSAAAAAQPSGDCGPLR
ncbi:hypothetical protein GGR34_002039 [Microvirga flocculans]|uniref:Uncharacterized protein n=1 Tax=Microvirga flocculans TaxID=217168 RepID=A0A7W6IF76_9HYPH|nr:hypothetical protein [Microvirga flocculans]MBB4040386.1 hypothetical protein [Microvirga flocculans]